MDRVSGGDEGAADSTQSVRGLKIAILSRKGSLYSTKRLKESGERRGHEMQVVDYLRCYMNITSHRPSVMYQGRELQGFDAVIPRVGASKTFYGAAVVRQFEMMGVFASNSSEAISRSRDKLRCLQMMASQGVGLPVTGFAHSTKDTEQLIRIVGGAPLVVKLLEGTQGIGVILAETSKAAEAVIEGFRQLDANILVQEYIRESGGVDVRCVVVGGRVVAAVRRRAKAGEFRANVHRGGTAERVKLTSEERSIAVRAAKILGLGVAGVDLLRSNHGPVVIEVNSSPGLEGVESATGIDVGGRIIEFLEKNVRRGAVKERAAV